MEGDGEGKPRIALLCVGAGSIQYISGCPASQDTSSLLSSKLHAAGRSSISRLSVLLAWPRAPQGKGDPVEGKGRNDEEEENEEEEEEEEEEGTLSFFKDPSRVAPAGSVRL